MGVSLTPIWYLTNSMPIKKRQPKSPLYYAVVTVLFMIPVVLLVVGAASLLGANQRTSMITLYNKRARLWNKHGLEDFRNLAFNITVDGVNYQMEENRSQGGEFFPVRDNCSLEGDPSDGCLSTDSLYYSQAVAAGEKQIRIEIFHEGILVVNDTLDPRREQTIDVRRLACNHNPKDCVKECNKYNGKWDSKKEVCVYQEYLQNVCYRVDVDEDVAVLDSPPEWDLDTKGIGCRYANHWSPYTFGVESQGSIPIEVRYYQDSVISASYTTRGCSDVNTGDAKCMGLTTKEASKVGIAFSLLGFAILVFLIVMMMIVNYCRRVVVDSDEYTPLPDV